MSTMNNQINRKKHIPALIAAFGMTALIGFVMLALGANALFNKQVSSAKAAAAATEIVTPAALTVEDLQALVTEYQGREVQYQAELTQAAEQLTQTNTELQQYQSLIAALQNAGVIQINADGQVMVMTNPLAARQGQGEREGFSDDGD